MVRLVILLLSRRWGLIIVGALLVIGGLAWGTTGSHQVNYVKSNDNTEYRIGKGETSGNVYIHANGSDEYYAAFASDFTVAQSDIDDSQSLSFVARDDTSSLDPSLNAPDGKTINEAHKIEKLVFYDTNGDIMHTYTTDEYKANPHGFYTNEWAKAIWLVVLGAVLALAALFVRRKKQIATASFNVGVPGAQPYQQPGPYAQPQSPNPYGQAYPGPQQYPQGAPAYPPTQYAPPPGNPYQQPPQG